MSLGSATAAHAVASYGLLDNPPGVFFGTGNQGTGNWTIETANNVQIGLRAKDRATLATIDGSSGVYHANIGLCNPVCCGAPNAAWNYEWSVNTGTGNNLSNFVVQLRIDTDPGTGTSFVTIGNAFTNWPDNSYWNSVTSSASAHAGPPLPN